MPSPTVAAYSVGPFESNCFFLIDETNDCVVIDPGDDGNALREEIERRGLKPIALLLTHGHIDHITGLPELLSRHPVPVYLHPDDAAWAFEPQNRLPPWYNGPPSPAPVDVRDPRSPAPLVIGPWSFRVLETPGHSPGSVCYYLPEQALLFSGDTLFQGSIGRTDLPGGDAGTIEDSLQRLSGLPPETRVFPGHGPETNIADECRMNPWLRS